MRKTNPKNERIKHEYLGFLEAAKRMKPETVDQVAAAINGFEESTKGRDFALFHKAQAIKFKRDLDSQTVAKSGRPLAVATKVTRLRHVQAFFRWLAGQPGYKRKLSYSEAEYFNPSNHESAIASAELVPRVPTVEQIRLVIEAMPVATIIERRNRALIAFTFITGARDAAIASLKLKHVNAPERRIVQDAREVKTKYRHTFETDFIGIDAVSEQIVLEWLEELCTIHHFGETDPVFPTTAMKLDDRGQFHRDGISRDHWRSAAPIREVFKNAFTNAGLPYFNPHSLRKTIWLWGERNGFTLQQMKALSLNLGHRHMRTSIESYGPMSQHERREIIQGLKHVGHLNASNSAKAVPTRETISQVLTYLQQKTP